MSGQSLQSSISPKDFGKVAVLLGGASAEREISLLSGNAVLAALQSAGVDAYGFDPSERPVWELKQDKVARVFIALHGRGGEDGTVQAALEIMQIPYTGSGVMASSLAMDKWRTKMIWLANGLPTPRYYILNEKTDWNAVVADLGLPIFVKPVHEGSSVGATKVVAAEQLKEAWELAARYDSIVIAEEFITGQELTAPFLGDMPLPLVRIVAPGGKYDYQNKYFTDDTQYFCPSGLAATQEQELQCLVMQSAAVLGCSGWGRADLILTDAGKPYLLEMNTSPGMTAHSLVPMAARATGIEFPDLCVRILAGASLG